MFSTYIVDPGDVGADPGEHGGLLGVVAAHAGAKAHNTMDIPGAIRVLTVQGSARVSLEGNRDKCDIRQDNQTDAFRTFIDKNAAMFRFAYCTTNLYVT